MSAWMLLGLGFVAGVISTVAIGLVLTALHELGGWGP